MFGFFAPQWRLVAPIEVKFGKEEQLYVRSYLPNFTLIGSGVWFTAPKLKNGILPI